MTAIDVAALRRHIGTRIADEDIATEAPLKAIVATFDRQEEAPRQGEPIPPGWHIGYFLSMAPTATLAADGLPAGTGVLPKLPLPRRMYAGTRITFHAPILVGDRLRREIELTDLQVREGGTGTLVITTQTRRISTPRGLAVTEEYDTVFREAVKPGAKSGIPRRDEVPADLPWRRTVTPDPVGAVSLLGHHLQPAPHPLRPRLRHGGRGLSGPRRAWPLHAGVPDRLRARQQSGAVDANVCHARQGAAVRGQAVRPGGPPDRGRPGVRGLGRDAGRHSRHAGERDFGVGRQKLGFVANGVNCSSCVQQDLSWVCR